MSARTPAAADVPAFERSYVQREYEFPDRGAEERLAYEREEYGDAERSREDRDVAAFAARRA